MTNIVIVLFLISLSYLNHANGYIVDGNNGNDNNSGEDVDNAFKTIARCVQSLSKPGDECQLRAGYYHEVVDVSGLKGE